MHYDHFLKKQKNFNILNFLLTCFKIIAPEKFDKIDFPINFNVRF